MDSLYCRLDIFRSGSGIFQVYGVSTRLYPNVYHRGVTRRIYPRWDNCPHHVDSLPPKKLIPFNQA